MTLATHIAIAGALGAPFVGAVPPVALFAFALGSHYLADTVPHYDYKLRYAFNEGPNPPRFNLLDFLIHDCGRVGFDIALGATLAVAALGLENFLAHPLPPPPLPPWTWFNSPCPPLGSPRRISFTIFAMEPRLPRFYAFKKIAVEC